MRIYADCPWEAVPRRPRQWSTFCSLVDPLAALLTYFTMVLALRMGPTEGDAILLIGAFLLLYPGKIPFSHLTGSVVALLLRASCAFGVMFATVRWVQGRHFDLATAGSDPALAWALSLPFVLMGLHSVSPWLTPHLRRFYSKTQVIIVGVNGASVRLAEGLRSGRAEGQQLVGCFEDRGAERTRAPEWLVRIGGLADVASFVQCNGVAMIYISLPMASQPRVLALLDELRDTTASVCFIPDISVVDLIQGSIDSVAGVPVVSVCDTPFRGRQAIIKRALDIAITLAALPIAVPVMTVIALAIHATSTGPVFFRQRRFGLDGREIVVWKFRTMRIMEDGDRQYRQVTRHDDRVTAVGRVLRRTSLDELPQLLNVLGGSMSLVGPRPHALAVNQQYRKIIPGYMLRHKVRPGITGWAQVNGYRGGDDLDSMRKRTEYDIAYLRSWSVTLDLLILLRTVRILLAGDPKAY